MFLKLKSISHRFEAIKEFMSFTIIVPEDIQQVCLDNQYVIKITNIKERPPHRGLFLFPEILIDYIYLK